MIVKKKRLQYDWVNLERVYIVCKGGMLMYKVVIIYFVFEVILRDRIREKIFLDVYVGYLIIFIVNEEKVLVDYIKYMGVRIQLLVRDYVVFFGKSIRGKDFGFLFCNCWFYGFLGGWQDFKVFKLQLLVMNRVELVFRENLNMYYKEFYIIFIKSNFYDKFENIYNIDEIGFSIEYFLFKNYL